MPRRLRCCKGGLCKADLPSHLLDAGQRFKEYVRQLDDCQVPWNSYDTSVQWPEPFVATPLAEMKVQCCQLMSA